MTSPKQLKYWRKNIKIIYRILFGFICNFNCIKKLHVFKTAFLCQKNVHLVLIILIRRGKFVLSFLDFYLFFCDFFYFGEIYFKKKTRRARPGRRPSRAGRPRRRRLLRASAAAD